MAGDVLVCSFSEPYYHKFQHDCHANYTLDGRINAAFVFLNLILLLTVENLGAVDFWHCIGYVLAMYRMMVFRTDFGATGIGVDLHFQLTVSPFFHKFLKHCIQTKL
jgi:hypothetical protein